MATDLETLTALGADAIGSDADVQDRPKATFLPEPERRPRHNLIISVDDHLVEPPDTFENRLPASLQPRAPRVITTKDGGHAWLYDGNVMPNVGFNAVVGRPIPERSWEPARFDEMRRGAWDPNARVADMDINGVYASISFPSYLIGFGGGRIQTITKDRELALATVRAFNDWQLESWVGARPDRLIPLAITWLHDPLIGAREIYRNAERGVHALTFPEAPHRLGLPSIYDAYWEPILRACAETGTVVCLHVGSGGSLPQSDAPGAPVDVQGVMFEMLAMGTALDWLFSLWPSKLPDLKIALSEGGIGWIAGTLDRIDHLLSRRGDAYGTWGNQDLSPTGVLLRNFYFCFLTDRISLQVRKEIGVDHIMYEVDYPHSDSTWPNSQQHLLDQVNGIPQDEIDRMCWRTASELFQIPVPEGVLNDLDAF